jgi:hypothetical protein
MRNRKSFFTTLLEVDVRAHKDCVDHSRIISELASVFTEISCLVSDGARIEVRAKKESDAIKPTLRAPTYAVLRHEEFVVSGKPKVIESRKGIATAKGVSCSI